MSKWLVLKKKLLQPKNQKTTISITKQTEKEKERGKQNDEARNVQNKNLQETHSRSFFSTPSRVRREQYQLDSFNQ